MTNTSFEDAVRKFFNVDESYDVNVEMVGEQEYQIGDYTWGSDPAYIEVRVRQFGNDASRQSMRFDSLPELWQALTPTE